MSFTAPNSGDGQSRRSFVRNTALASVVWAQGGLSSALGVEKKSPEPLTEKPAAEGGKPWYRRTYRWGQTNITESDAAAYDVAWWREYWKRTGVQGVIINAAGIVAYYPSKFPLQYRAPMLGNRDLYGDLAQAAHADGLAVLARMDSNRTHEEFFKAHPDWFARDSNGHPYRAADLFVTCINSPYYEEWIPGILREIIERTQPEGITDNSWSGLGRSSVCYCDHCARHFRDRYGHSLPREKNWNDPGYRDWILWNYARRSEFWEANNRVTQDAGGPHCLWIGMNSGSTLSQSQSFRDDKEICHRAEMLLLDHQARSDGNSFQQNAEAGRRLHGLLGWDRLIPESMALYQAGHPTFRKASKPEPEVRLWVLEAFAGGIQSWWHHVGATQEDRRQFRTIESLNRWHRANESYLINRRPVATVGVVWSQQNLDFYGRDHAEELVELPARGMANALVRARIPWLPIHIDLIDRDSTGLRALILPNLGAMSALQTKSIRQFVERGGGLLATGDSSLYDEWGDARSNFSLADLLQVRFPPTREPLLESARAKQGAETLHTYLRLPPEAASRHPVLRGFEETDLLPYGGMLDDLIVSENAVVPLTFVPAFPVYPPETSWMRQPKTSLPGLILNTRSNGGRVAYLPADIDRRFGHDNLPDHGDLLANLVRWVSQDDLPLKVEGAGLIDCQLYRQEHRLILHLVNLTNAGTWRQPVHELIPIGPLTVKIKLPESIPGRKLRLLVSDQTPSLLTHEGWAIFGLKSILDHEVAIID